MKFTHSCFLSPFSNSPLRWSALPILLSALLATAEGTERRFAYTYETTTTPKGGVELENWVTWKRTNDAGPSERNFFEFRHEIEFGITDRLQVGVYLFDWEANAHHEVQWQHSGVEVIYNLTNASTDFLGSAIYGEVVVGESSIELEGKLLLQKNFGPFRASYNLVLEGEWEGDRFGRFDERNGEFAQSLGISYDLTKQVSIGAEVLHEIPLPDWSDAADSNVFAGPNASLRFGRVFVTATALFQLTSVKEEPEAQVRLITGFEF